MRAGRLFLLLILASFGSGMDPGFSAQSAAAPSHGKIRRLILKDGTYESVIQYEVKGDRVRYLSSESREWEELPVALIDWTATEAYAREAETAGRDRIRESEESASSERANEAARRPMVAPGIQLPEDGGVYLLDVYQGKAGLYIIKENEASIDKNTAGNILRGAINPIASARQTFELKGPHAEIQAHVSAPSIYLTLSSDANSVEDFSPAEAKEHLRIVRCESRKENRVVGSLQIAVYGKVKEQAAYIEAAVEPVSGPWLKITPNAPLAPGEYALVEILGNEGMNLFVWDFGVKPAAPINKDAYTPEPGRPDKPPELHQPTTTTKPGSGGQR